MYRLFGASMGGCHQQSIVRIIFSSITERKAEMESKKGRPKGMGNILTPPPEHPLLDQIKDELHLSSDGQLCEVLKVSRSTLSKIRHGINGVSADFILRVHKTMGWPVERIEQLLSTEARW